MSVVKAWKDADHRDNLSEAELLTLPVNPAGLVEMDADSLARTPGGTFSVIASVIGSAIVSATVTYNVCESLAVGTCQAYGSRGCC